MKVRCSPHPYPRTFGPRSLKGSLRPGGEVVPTYKLYTYVPPHRVGFLSRFGLKTGLIHFAPFDLESGMVFEGTTGVYKRIYRFNSKWVRKKEISEFKIVFVCALI